MRQRFEPRQPEETAGPLDGVDETKNVTEKPGVVRILLEPDEFHVDGVETLVGLGQELTQQLVHGKTFADATQRHTPPFGSAAVCCERV